MEKVEVGLGELNHNDLRLLYLCKDNAKSVTELSKEMEIAQKNIIVRLKKLEESKRIVVERLGKGKKTLIKTNIKHPNFKDILLVNQFIEVSNKALNSEKRDAFLKALDETHKKFKIK